MVNIMVMDGIELTWSDSKTDSKSATKATAKATAKTDSKSATKSATKATAKTDSKSATKSATKATAKTDSKSATKSATKATAKTDSKSATKSATKATAKTDSKSATKSATKATAKSDAIALVKEFSDSLQKQSFKSVVDCLVHIANFVSDMNSRLDVNENFERVQSFSRSGLAMFADGNKLIQLKKEVVSANSLLIKKFGEVDESVLTKLKSFETENKGVRYFAYPQIDINLGVVSDGGSTVTLDSFRVKLVKIDSFSVLEKVINRGTLTAFVSEYCQDASDLWASMPTFSAKVEKDGFYKEFVDATYKNIVDLSNVTRYGLTQTRTDSTLSAIILNFIEVCTDTDFSQSPKLLKKALKYVKPTLKCAFVNAFCITSAGNSRRVGTNMGIEIVGKKRKRNDGTDVANADFSRSIYTFFVYCLFYITSKCSESTNVNTKNQK